MGQNDILTQFIVLAMADGIIKEEERELLYKLGEQYEYTKEEIDEELSGYEDGAIGNPVNLDYDTTSRIVDFIRMAVVDGEIQSAEKDALHRLIGMYGYSREEIDELISIANSELYSHPMA